MSARPGSPVTVAVCDDHPIVREGFRQLIDAEPGLRVIREFGRIAEVLAPGALDGVCALVLDLSLPDGDGLSVLDALRSRQAPPVVVVLSMHDGPSYARDALERGANGFVSKREAAETLVEALRIALDGEVYLDAELASRVYMPPVTLEGLTQRQLEILRRLARGEEPQHIAQVLSLSSKTVYTHRARILERLKVRNFRDLLRVARERGLLED